MHQVKSPWVPPEAGAFLGNIVLGMLISAPTATIPSHRKSHPTATGDSTKGAPSPRAPPKHWLSCRRGSRLLSGPKITEFTQRTSQQKNASPNLSRWLTEAQQRLPPAPGLLGSPAPGSQSFMLRVLTLIRVRKCPGHRTPGMSAMMMVVVEEEEVGKSRDRATTIPSGKQGKCAPGIPIWT